MGIELVFDNKFCCSFDYLYTFYFVRVKMDSSGVRSCLLYSSYFYGLGLEGEWLQSTLASFSIRWWTIQHITYSRPLCFHRMCGRWPSPCWWTQATSVRQWSLSQLSVPIWDLVDSFWWSFGGVIVLTVDWSQSECNGDSCGDDGSFCIWDFLQVEWVNL